jgi:hypothetical protein
VNYKTAVNRLWEQLEDALTRGYKTNAEVREHLRDYVPDVGWNDKLAALVGREAAAEREHRKFVGGEFNENVPVGVSARLMVVQKIGEGAQLASMPLATDFLNMRHSAVEARVVGYLLREVLSEEWVAEAVALDYAKAVSA